MKILHTADWHLGKRLENFSRIEEQKEVLQEICEIADKENVNAIVISGDLFDNFNPSTEAVEVFYKTLKKLTNNGNRAVIAIAGNHDSPDRIEAPEPLARECGIIFAGYPNTIIPFFKLESGLKILNTEAGFIELKIPDCAEPLRILLTPYANEFRLKTFLAYKDTEEELRNILEKKWNSLADEYCDNKGVNILATHLFVVGKGEKMPEEPEDEKPILHIGGAQAIYTENIPDKIQYTALGHLHKKRILYKNKKIIAYSGSPIAYSFGEANQDKYVIIADIEPGSEANLKEIMLTKGKRLLRKRAYGIDEAIVWLKENTDALVELTLVTDDFIRADERKLLSNTHQGIISIIPEVKNKNFIDEDYRTKIDLSKSRKNLFIEYFKHEKGQNPNERILNLFDEIISEEGEV